MHYKIGECCLEQTLLGSPPVLVRQGNALSLRTHSFPRIVYIVRVIRHFINEFINSSQSPTSTEI